MDAKRKRVLSKPEETFALQLRTAKIPFTREYQFAKDKGRKWRADFFIEQGGLKLLVEIEGGLWVRGRHNRGAGMEKDMEKYNAASEAGYMLLRFSPKQVNNLVALEAVERVFGSHNVRKVIWADR